MSSPDRIQLPLWLYVIARTGASCACSADAAPSGVMNKLCMADTLRLQF